MEKHYHILNGDALKEQFPKSISGVQIITRECLVYGDVKADSLSELLELRAKVLSESYDGVTKEVYYENTVPEIEKILNIEPGSVVYLWFEDDLFCQVNFWFVLSLLKNLGVTLYLVRPQKHTQYGFGGLNSLELEALLECRIYLDDVNELADLWTAYQESNLQQLLQLAENLQSKYPFILPAVQAHKDRIPVAGKRGRPRQALVQIIEDLGTTEFGAVFQEFSKRESIYGYGDLQVKRLLATL